MNNEQEFKYVMEEGEEQETVDLAGYQVTKAELFAHTREPAIQHGLSAKIPRSNTHSAPYTSR